MSVFAFSHYKSMGKFNALINQYKLNDTIFLLAKCKHTIPDEAGIFNICRECMAAVIPCHTQQPIDATEASEGDGNPGRREPAKLFVGAICIAQKTTTSKHHYLNRRLLRILCLFCCPKRYTVKPLFKLLLFCFFQCLTL